MSQPIDWTGVREITERSRKTPGHPMNLDTEKTMPQTTTQRTAKHRLAVKERLQRYERALRDIAALEDSPGRENYDCGYDLAIYKAAQIAESALNYTAPAKS